MKFRSTIEVVLKGDKGEAKQIRTDIEADCIFGANKQADQIARELGSTSEVENLSIFVREIKS